MPNSNEKPLLLVPINLSAFIESVKNSRNIADITPSYDNLRYNDKLTGDTVGVKPFAIRGGSGWAGVHLHWALPDALTHSREGGDGNIFPAVPNRWLIQRYCKKDRKIERKVWVIESDFYTLEKTKEMATAPDITIPTFKLTDDGTYSWQGSKRYAWQGRCYVLGAKAPLRNGKDGYLERLTAVGAGNPLFAASYQQCAGVFGFYDKLEGVEKGKVSYLVTGWFSKVSDDPINISKTLVDCLTFNDWALPEKYSSGDEAFCSLYHGRLHSINWCGADGEYKSSIPESKGFTIGFGNSSQEVLSAILSDGSDELERILQILQSQSLKAGDTPDGLIDAEQKLHAEQFSTIDGGTTWKVVTNKIERKRNENLLASIHKKIAPLNTLQNDYEKLAVELSELQEECNALWYIYINAKHGEDEEELSLIEDIASKLQSKCRAIEEIRNKLEVEPPAFQVSNIKLGRSNNIEMGRQGKPRFYQPLTPVVLIKGKGLRFYKHGEDGLLDCRLSNDIVSIVVIKINGQRFTLDRASLANILPEPLAKHQYIDDISDLPVGYRSVIISTLDDLFFEALLLDASYDDFFIEIVSGKSNLKYSSCKEVLKGVEPSSADETEWQQPWEPILLDWKVELKPFRTPIKKRYEDYKDDTLSAFTFGDIDFISPMQPPSKEISPIILEGQTIITPHAAHILQEHLNKAIELFPEIAKMLKVSVKDLELLSQALTSFNEKLLMRKFTLQLPIHDTIEPDENLIRNVIKALDPLNSKISNEVINVSPRLYSVDDNIESSTFLPLRGCEVSLSSFRIVDSFGQTLDLTGCKKVIPSSMRASYSNIEKAILKPRLLQSARFDFRWVAANNNDIDSNGDMETSPILCFILPNFLDGNITFFDEKGKGIGRVKETFFNKKSITLWQAEFNGAESVDDIYNAHVRQFVKQLMKTSTNSESSNFSQLLAYIQKELADIIPENSTGSFISQFFGRPLALARLRLGLSLRGNIAFSQELKYLEKGINFDYHKSLFNFYLGDTRKLNDGLLGVFKEEDAENSYDKFFVRWGASANGSYFSKDKSVALTAEKGYSQFLTALFDPVAAIHALSGILPSKSITLPEFYYGSIINNLEISFSVNPLLTESDKFVLPIPCAEDEKLWRWSIPSEEEKAAARTFPILELDYFKAPKEPALFDGRLIRHEPKK